MLREKGLEISSRRSLIGAIDYLIENVLPRPNTAYLI